MKPFRTIIFWSHLLVALVIAPIVLLMSVTGVLLTYERQVTEWAETRGLDTAPPTLGAQPLRVEQLLDRVQEQGLDAPRAVTWVAGEEGLRTVSLGRRDTRYVNAYTGEVLEPGGDGVGAFFHTMMEWHRWLGADGAGRDVGRAVTGACNLGFLFLLVSGFYLWWPRNWRRRAVRNVTWFRRGLSPKARDFNWHNVVGFWSLVPLVVIVVSGAVISYAWAGDLVYTLAGGEAPTRGRHGPPAGEEAREAETPSETALPHLMELDALFARAAERLPDWHRISLQVPDSSDATATFTLDAGTGGQPQKRADLTLSRTTGEEVRWAPFETVPAGRQARAILRFAHTGEVLGLLGQTLAGLVSLGTALLVWTGLALTWRRFRTWRRRKRRRQYA